MNDVFEDDGDHKLPGIERSPDPLAVTGTLAVEVEATRQQLREKREILLEQIEILEQTRFLTAENLRSRKIALDQVDRLISAIDRIEHPPLRATPTPRKRKKSRARRVPAAGL